MGKEVLDPSSIRALVRPARQRWELLRSDEEDFRWFHAGGSAKQQSNIVAIIDKLRSYGLETKDCEECGGAGFPGAKKPATRRKGRTKDYLEKLELQFLAAQSRADAKSPRGVCKECEGSGVWIKRRSGAPESGTSAWPTLGGTGPCPECKGLCRNKTCPLCAGDGYVWLNLSGYSVGAHESGAVGTIDDVGIGRAGRIFTGLQRAAAIWTPTPTVLGRYYGDDGAVAGDPLIALYPETEGGKRLLGMSDNPNNLGPILRLREDVSSEKSTSDPKKRELLSKARIAAIELYHRACTAWWVAVYPNSETGKALAAKSGKDAAE